MARVSTGIYGAVSAHIEELGRERIDPVFLLDESHLLHQDVLELAPWIRSTLIRHALGKEPGTIRTQVSSITAKTGTRSLDRAISSALASGYVGRMF